MSELPISRRRGAPVQARKALGQHFLHDTRVLQRIAALAAPVAGSGLLEIGPGTGNLTALLLEHGVTLRAIEKDRRCVEVLRAEFGARLDLREADATRVDWAELLGEATMGPAPVVVGNLPYNVAAPILFGLLESSVRPQRIVVMLQREVADRLLAGPGSSAYGQPSVKVQMVADVRLGLRVGRGAFTPAPRVDNAVVVIEPLAAPRFPVPDIRRFGRLVAAGFGQRRKTLANALSNGLGIDGDVVRAALTGLDLDERVRGEALSVERWAALCRSLDAVLIDAQRPKRERRIR